MKKTLYFVSTVWLWLVVQQFSNHWLGGSWFSMDWILITALYFGLARGPLVGQVVGLSWGLLVDASSLGLMGVHTLLYALAGYTGGMLRRQLDETKIWSQAIFSFGISCAYAVGYLFLDRLFSTGSGTLSWRLGAQPFVNALVAPIIFLLMQLWSDVWGIYPVES